MKNGISNHRFFQNMVQEAYLIQAYVTATDFCYTVYAILVSLRPKRFETVNTEHFESSA